MRGINFARLPSATHLDLVREAGFDVVRLAVEWDGAGFRQVDAAIGAALERGFAVVVDVHHFRGTDREWLGTAWNAEDGRSRVRTDLEGALAYGRPLLLGEFGTIAHAAMADRAAWTRAVREEAERLGIDWCYWDFATDFGAYDPQAGTWHAPLLDALMAR